MNIYIYANLYIYINDIQVPPFISAEILFMPLTLFIINMFYHERKINY